MMSCSYICWIYFIMNVVFYLKILLDMFNFCISISLAYHTSDSPFKNHIIGNISNYYYSLQNINTSFENLPKNNNYTLNYYNKRKNIFQKGFKEITSNNINHRQLFSRKLKSGSFCSDIYESFVKNKNKRLSYIFELNYKTINGISISLIIVHFFAVISFIILKNNNDQYQILQTFKQILKSIKEFLKNACPRFNIIFRHILFIPWIAKFVLSLLLLYYIEEADIGKYNDFLDCKYVKKEFFKKFSDANRVVLHARYYAIISLISEIIDKALEFIEIHKDNEGNEENQNSQTQKDKF